MVKVPTAVVVLCVAFLPAIAEACRGMMPNEAALNEYTSVFVGEVTGVHLKGVENELLGEPDGVDPELGALTITNGASPVSIRVVVTKKIRGAASGALDLQLAGCTFDPPSLGERAIFVLPDSDSVVFVRERDKPTYDNWLDRLAVAPLTKHRSGRAELRVSEGLEMKLGMKCFSTAVADPLAAQRR